MKKDFEIDYIAGSIVADVGQFVIPLYGKHIFAGPNGSGKTMIMKLIQSTIELMGGRPPVTLHNFVSRCCGSYYSGVHVEYSKLFDYFELQMKNGLSATIKPVDKEPGCFFEYTCGEETVELDISKYSNVQTSQQVPVTSILLEQDRHCYFGRLIYEILSNGIVHIDKVTMWHNLLIDCGRRPDFFPPPYAGIPTWKPDEKRNVVVKRIDNWFDSLSHGEQELFLHQIALQNYDYVLIDGVENGLHILLQEKYHDMIRSYRPELENFFITTHSPSIPQCGLWHRVIELSELNKDEECKDSQSEQTTTK